MLYHVSIRKIDEFKLRIPINFLNDENSEIKRICFSRTIEGAISAMPYGFDVMLGLMDLNKRYNIPPIIYVHMVDEREIDRQYILKSKVLKKKSFVPDAKINSEVWLLTNNFNYKIKAIQINDFYMYDAKIGKNEYVRCIDDLSYDELDTDSELVKVYNQFWNVFEDKFWNDYVKFNNYGVEDTERKDLFISIAKREFIRNFRKL